MSDIKDLQNRALAIRQKYEEYEQRRIGRTWSTKDLAMGFVVDLGELIELIMAKEGLREVDDVDSKLAHELADCLWSILVLADKYGVDIEKAFTDEFEAKMEKKLR
jgi:NTP pyrophosphatase (non-canonical NTP hydrolase)